VEGTVLYSTTIRNCLLLEFGSASYHFPLRLAVLASVSVSASCSASYSVSFIQRVKYLNFTRAYVTLPSSLFLVAYRVPLSFLMRTVRPTLYISCWCVVPAFIVVVVAVMAVVVVVDVLYIEKERGWWGI